MVLLLMTAFLLFALAALLCLPSLLCAADAKPNVLLICVDDLDRVTGEPDWERALFTLYNALDGAYGGADPEDIKINDADYQSGLVHRQAAIDEAIVMPGTPWPEFDPSAE